VAPSEKFPFFQAMPSRRRSWAYRSISAYDAMQVRAAMLAKYPIDEERIYLVGSSAGGSGAMHLASQFPDQFAAVMPLIAAGNYYPLVNFRNLPVAFHHGDRDWTSAICNARVQQLRMEKLGCPVLLKEYPGAGHRVPGSHEPLVEWLFEQRLNPLPNTITHECEAPSLGRSYWFTIHEFKDPHERASVEAVIEKRTAILRMKNVASFGLASEILEKIDAVEIDGQRYDPQPTFRDVGGTWEHIIEKPRNKRLYESGAAANLYQGEPLLIVYEDEDYLRRAANKLAGYGGSIISPFGGKFPVVAADDLTDEQASSHNLIVLAEHLESPVGGTFLPDLGFSSNLSGAVAGVFHYNQRFPNRLVYVVAPYVEMDDEYDIFANDPQLFLAGSDGFDRISQPDIQVRTFDGRIRVQAQFDKDWSLPSMDAGSSKIPPKFQERAELARVYMDVMLGKSDADFALWWGPEDQGMWGADFNFLAEYDPAVYSRHHFQTQRRMVETTLGRVTGEELREVWTRWGLNEELISEPEIDFDELAADETYALHIPMDLYIKLGQRKKNLREPKPGPLISPREVEPLIFQ
ncbi:MAG: hypothetical protein AAF585_21585, partial [Verrucomicrobiota bacterium]